MSARSIDEIKEAIAALSEQDRLALASWLSIQTMDEWDREMERDFSSGGAGHHLVEKVRADIRAGKFSPMSKGKPRRG